MDDDVGPANELALRIRRHLTDQGFDVIVLVEVAEGAQPFIDVTFPDGDGFGTWGSPVARPSTRIRRDGQFNSATSAMMTRRLRRIAEHQPATHRINDFAWTLYRAACRAISKKAFFVPQTNLHPDNRRLSSWGPSSVTCRTQK